MAMNGLFLQEFRRRKEQLDELASTLTQRPLTRIEAYVLYSSRYLPAVRYFLHHTCFSIQDARKLETKWMLALLPKLGYNRNMPRAIIFGPQDLGGSGLIKIEYQQVACQTEDFICTLRKGDDMSMNYKIAAEAIQALLGSNTQFFLLDPTRHPHRPKNTRLGFLWEQLHKYNARIEAHDLWMPPLAHTNDRNIMDDFLAQQDKRKGILSAVHPKDLINANACRLYLKVYNISDITTSDGNEIAAWAMDGTDQKETHLIFPYQEKTHYSAWQTWRRHLRHTYLV